MLHLSLEMTALILLIDSPEAAEADKLDLYFSNNNQHSSIKDSSSSNMEELFKVKISKLQLILHLTKAEEVNLLSKISLNKTCKTARHGIVCRVILLGRSLKPGVACKTHRQ